MTIDITGVSYSCSSLDGAIDGIEEARSLHDELRTVAVEALERVEELEAEVIELEKELSKYV